VLPCVPACRIWWSLDSGASFTWLCCWKHSANMYAGNVSRVSSLWIQKSSLFSLLMYTINFSVWRRGLSLVVGVAVTHPNDRSSIPIRDEFRNCHAKSRFYYIKKCLVPPRHGFIFFKEEEDTYYTLVWRIASFMEICSFLRNIKFEAICI
jgi:hypothetical protein